MEKQVSEEHKFSFVRYNLISVLKLLVRVINANKATSVKTGQIIDRKGTICHNSMTKLTLLNWGKCERKRIKDPDFIKVYKINFDQVFFVVYN